MELREFALEVVTRLQQAGFEALWAGGCVRDQLMGREPKDYDVATNATPDQVRQLFGFRRTLPIGAAFGVIAVIGPRPLGPIEVATFRSDVGYSDGRHPDSVKFTNAQEDAARRDFTINGMFYNPITNQVIDYVGGKQDIEAGIVRAIGDPKLRIGEDKLRMLRGVRFATKFGFQLDEATKKAITQSAAEIQGISAERIGSEVTRILSLPNRGQGVELLFDTGLLQEILPTGLGAVFSVLQSRRQEIISRLDQLDTDRFEPALFLLFQPYFLMVLTDEDSQVQSSEPSLKAGEEINETAAIFDQIELLRDRSTVRAKQISPICQQLQTCWKLTNQQRDDLAWIANYWQVLDKADRLPWAFLQPLLLEPACELGLTVVEAIHESSSGLEFCRCRLASPRDQLDPPYLLTGDDLNRMGLVPGPQFKRLIQGVRDRQLQGSLTSKVEAEGWVMTNQSRC